MSFAEYDVLVKHFTRQIDKTTISGLPRYEDHRREVILVGDHNLDLAVDELLTEAYLGFDTESKPNFKKGEKSNGISLIQISSVTRCYLFQVNKITDIAVLGDVVNHPEIIKVGVGLRDDHTKLRSNFKFNAQAFVDLGTIFRSFGRKNTVGSKQLVALVMNQKLRKSKRATTSNWATEKLSPLQIEYASDDAFSSVDVYLGLREVFKPHTGRLDRNLLKLLDL